MRGLTVTIRERSLAGVLENGTPVWAETLTEVDNVLVGEPGPEETAAETGMPGRRLSYLLGIPKGDGHDWKEKHVSWTGPDGKEIHVRTFGDLISGVERMIPGPWHQKAKCCRFDPEQEQACMLWSVGRLTVIYGAYLVGKVGAERIETGKNATDEVTLILPGYAQAVSGGRIVTFCKPKAYAALPEADKADRFTLDDRSFFLMDNVTITRGLHLPEEVEGFVASSAQSLWCYNAEASEVNYQTLNSLFDDVYRVSGAAWRNTGIDTEYLEVMGR